MGVIYPVITGIRSTGLYFVTDHVLVCGHHSRGMKLQPFSSYDRECGYGKFDCPFCSGGLLEGTFYLHRSQKAVLAALEKLDRTTQNGFESYKP
jgi:hypothetical protein